MPNNVDHYNFYCICSMSVLSHVTLKHYLIYHTHTYEQIKIHIYNYNINAKLQIYLEICQNET